MKLIEVIHAQDLVGPIDNPLGGGAYAGLSGIGLLINNVLRLVFVVAGIFALFNFIIAGFQYMNAAGDSKALTAAWARIWQSLLGLVIMVGSFALAALFGQIFFNNPMFILQPKIYGPQ